MLVKCQHNKCPNGDPAVLLEKVPEAGLLSGIGGPENDHEREAESGLEKGSMVSSALREMPPMPLQLL